MMNWATIKALYSSWYAWGAPILIAIATNVREILSGIPQIRDFEFGFYSRVFLLSAATFVAFCFIAKIRCPVPIKRFRKQSEAADHFMSEEVGKSSNVRAFTDGSFEKEVDNLFSRYRLRRWTGPDRYQNVEGVGVLASKVAKLLPAKGPSRELRLAATDWDGCTKLYPIARFCLTALFSLAVFLYLCFFFAEIRIDILA